MLNMQLIYLFYWLHCKVSLALMNVFDPNNRQFLSPYLQMLLNPQGSSSRLFDAPDCSIWISWVSLAESLPGRQTMKTFLSPFNKNSVRSFLAALPLSFPLTPCCPDAEFQLETLIISFLPKRCCLPRCDLQQIVALNASDWRQVSAPVNGFYSLIFVGYRMSAGSF